jgi:Uma2 family endonuclease
LRPEVVVVEFQVEEISRGGNPMTNGILLEDDVRIPFGVDTLDAFRCWAFSPEFPDAGRIDYVAGSIEVDMSPDSISFHSFPKTEIGRVIGNRLKTTNLGHVCVDNSRVTCPDVELSVEPDVVVVTHAALASGRARLIPAASGRVGDFIEIEGSPDLVVEVVSRSSVVKDTKRLRTAYFDAGVSEYWLVDARGSELQFQMLVRGEVGFVPAPSGPEQFQVSGVLQASYRLERYQGPGGVWQYDLREQPL